MNHRWILLLCVFSALVMTHCRSSGSASSRLPRLVLLATTGTAGTFEIENKTSLTYDVTVETQHRRIAPGARARFTGLTGSPGGPYVRVLLHHGGKIQQESTHALGSSMEIR